MKLKPNYLLTLIVNLVKYILGSIPAIITLFIFYYFDNEINPVYISVLMIYGFCIVITILCVIIHLIISIFSKPLIIAEKYYFKYRNYIIKYEDIKVIELIVVQ